MNNSFNVRRSVSCAAILTIVAWLHLLLNVPMISQIYQRTENGVFVRIDSTIVGLQVCNEKILHITVTPVPQPPQHEKLVVTRTWEPCHWDVSSDAGKLIVMTTALRVEVNTTTGAISFYKRAGGLLVKEYFGRAHEIVRAQVANESTFHVKATFQLSTDEGIYGLGQFESGVMNYRGHDVTLIQNNRHVVVPFLVSSRNYGIYWDNYSHSQFHDGEDGMSLWSEVADGIDYYFFYGSNLDEVVAKYREATGKVPMLPKWAFGYWQSKERYESQAELLGVAKEYRRREIPIDNIVQDWQYWGKLGWNAMAFDDSLYPDPKAMIDSLHRVYNMHLMVSIWPQVGPNTDVYRELSAKEHLYPTEVWNGGKTYDAYSKEARDIFWKHLNNGLYALGVDAWWVDATEPDWKWCDSLLEEKEGIVRNGQTAIGTSSRYLNTYALVATSGIYENQRRANPNRRVFMLTRSAFAGQQRNPAAVWSGDISSNWKTLKSQVTAGINFSIAGMPYWNSDIGGFLPKEYGGEYPLGPRDPAYRELYVRWFQFGAFCPIFRAHGTDFGREVWQFGKRGSWGYDYLLKFITLRYRLLPYIYSTAWQVTKNHSTMMRGLPFDFGNDTSALKVGTEYMFGSSILVAPVCEGYYFPRNTSILVPTSSLSTPTNEAGLQGQYFRGMKFDSLVFSRRDSLIKFDWTANGVPGIGKDRFSVRWIGKVLAAETGKYEFETTSDDGVNLFVNGLQIMDEMYPSGRQMNVGEINLEANTWYDITFEYYQEDKHADVSLGWRTPSMLASYQGRKGLQEVRVYLPTGAGWYDFWTGRRYVGGRELEREVPLDIMPLFIKSGSILPVGPELQFSTEKPPEPLELRIYAGTDALLEYYEDEGDSYGYEQGIYAVIPMKWNEQKKILTIGDRKGSFPGMKTDREFRIVLVKEGHGRGGESTEYSDRVVHYDGRETVIKF